MENEPTQETAGDAPTTDEVVIPPEGEDRTTRDAGGPTSGGGEGEPGAEDTGAHGDIKTRGFEDDPHT